MKKIDILNVESRWMLAGIVAIAIFLLTYISDIQSMQGEVKMLRVDVSDVAQQININKNNVLLDEALPVSKFQHVDISELLNFIDDKRVLLQSGIDGVSYKLEIDINDSNVFIELLNMMERYGDKYSIESFNLTENAGNGFHVILALKIDDSQQIIVNSTVKQNWRLPFCNENNVKQNLPDQALHYELSDLQMLGTLQGQRGLGVLISFPNGVMRVMYQHDQLGRGGGEIENITTQSITIKTPNHHLTKLKLSQ